jgi:hypothetical protein
MYNVQMYMYIVQCAVYIPILYFSLGIGTILYQLPHIEEHVADTEIRTKLFIIVILYTHVLSEFWFFI